MRIWMWPKLLLWITYFDVHLPIGMNDKLYTSLTAKKIIPFHITYFRDWKLKKKTNKNQIRSFKMFIV